MEFSEFTFEVLGETHRIPTRSIYGIGRNYLKHIEELKNETPKEPVVFLKSQASLRPFQLPTTGESDLPIFYEEGIHFEAEITVLLGQTIPLGATAQHADIKGLGLGLDLTRRQVKKGSKTRAFLGLEPKTLRARRW